MPRLIFCNRYSIKSRIKIDEVTWNLFDLILSIIFLESEVYRWFDGHHHFDEICITTGIQDQMELQKICNNDPEVVIIRR